jgi:glycosyltransferase involved in cell wall biosynthesis
MGDSSSIAQPVRPKVLALGPQNVFPPVDGGKEGIYGALAALALHADVTYAFPNSGECLVDGYGQIGVTAVPYPYDPEERPFSILVATLVGKPYKFEKYSCDAAVRALCAALPTTSFTAIVCHHAHTFGLAHRFALLRELKVPIVVREHNIEYALVESYRDSLRGMKRIAASLFAWLTRREELKIWRKAAAVAFLSDQDIRTAKAAIGSDFSRFFLAREGIPIPPKRLPRHPLEQAPLLILLNPRASQSVVSLKIFMHQYWIPLRKQRLINNEILHVTGVTQEQLAGLLELDVEMMSNSGIQALGFLPSLKSTLEGALALVSPTFVGGGIRKKVLEAMAHQLPVIATELDISCCDYFKLKENILSMGDPESFANTVRRLRTDVSYWLNLSSSARDTVDEFANWENYGKEMFRIIDDLTHTKRH